MSEADHAYTPTATASAMPDAIARYLDGEDLLAKTQAIRLSTVDPAGWPHAALLSAGDAVVLASGKVRFAIFAQSSTVANLERDGRLTITLSVDGGMCDLRLRAHRLSSTATKAPLALFEAEIESVRTHVAPYAALTSGVTFSLHEPSTVLPRWQRQIAELRAAR